MKLDQNWVDREGHSFQSPFSSNEEALDLTYHFDLACDPDDSIYLAFDRIAWEAEIILNDRFIGINEKPFDPWLIPLSKNWLNSSGNTLVLKLSKLGKYPFYPSAILGILGDVNILEASHLTSWKTSFVTHVDTADSVAVMAPFFREYNYEFDLLEASYIVQPLLDYNIKHVYFPFNPDPRFSVFCNRMGLIQVDSLTPHTHIGLINTYPYEISTFSIPARFWLDEQGDRTKFYGYMPKLADQKSKPLGRESNTLLVFLVLFPLLSLFLIRLLNVGFFNTMINLFFSPKLYIESYTESSYSNLGLLILLVVFKALSLVVFLSVLIFYIQTENQWESIKILQEESLMQEYFYDTSSLQNIMSRSLILILGWYALKHLVLGVLSSIFRVKGFWVRVLNLDIVSAYPLGLLLSVPLSLMIFMDKLWGGGFVWVMLILIGLYMIRRLYVYYMGLGRMFPFSRGMKFLYICAFNILPYIIWL